MSNLPIQHDDSDIETVSLCVWKEARGEGQLGMKGVLDVICNRARDWHKTLHDVVYGKNQFTSMSVSSDPEFNLYPVDGDEQFKYATEITSQILETGMGDITMGAHYYANLKEVTSGWFSTHISGPDGNGTPEHQFTTQIGRHRFYV